MADEPEPSREEHKPSRRPYEAPQVYRVDLEVEQVLLGGSCKITGGTGGPLGRCALIYNPCSGAGS
jgi:hypothetical protein